MSAVLEFDVEIEGVDETTTSAVAVEEADPVEEATVGATAADAVAEAADVEASIAPPSTANEAVAQGVSPDGPQPTQVEYTPMVDSGRPEESPTPSPATATGQVDEAAKLQAEWESAMESLEHEISDLTIERIQLADRAKSIKKRIDCLAEELSDLRVSGPRRPIRKPVETSVDDSTAIPSLVGSSDRNVPSTQPASTNDPAATSDDWRSAKLEQLNLKKNIHEKLVESSVETIGQLEDMRAAISLGKQEWPKGIGKAKITQIEDAVIDWLTKHRDSGVFQSVGTAASTSQVTPSSPQPAPVSVPTNDEWNDWTDAQRSLYLTERAVALSSDQKDDLQKRLPDASYWESGREYFGRGAEIIDCPYTPGDWQDDWIRGFLSADMAGQPEEQAEAAESVEQHADEVDEEPTLEDEANTAVGSPEITLADL